LHFCTLFSVGIPNKELPFLGETIVVVVVATIVVVTVVVVDNVVLNECTS